MEVLKGGKKMCDDSKKWACCLSSGLTFCSCPLLNSRNDDDNYFAFVMSLRLHVACHI